MAPSGAPPPGRGLGADAEPDVNQSSRGAQADRGPLLEEEPKIEANKLPSKTSGGVLGTPAKLHARPRGRSDKAAGSARQEGRSAPSTNPAPGATSGLRALEAGGRVKEEGGRFSGDSAASVEGALKDWRQKKKAAYKEPQRYDTYTSTAMYFLRFSGPKMLLPLGDPFLLRSSSKSTQRRPKRWT